MPGALLGGAISGVGSIVGGILGNSAANKAAKLQQQAANNAATNQERAGTQAQDIQSGQIATNTANAQPYLGAGATAAGALNTGFGAGGNLGSNWNQTFSAPTAADAAATPGYQFQLQQGLAALQNSAAARGGLLSTGTAKNLEQYAQGTAASNYQNVFQNALNAYNTNYGVHSNEQNSLFNRLYSTAGLGESTAQGLANVNQAGTANLTGNIFNTAELAGQDRMGGATARAGGIVGGANALGGAISGGANALGQGISLSSILGARNASNQGSTAPLWGGS